jgi:hypothetical protein
MDIKELKKKLGLKDKDLAGFFGLNPTSYYRSSARRRYENSFIRIYEFLKRGAGTQPKALSDQCALKNVSGSIIADLEARVYSLTLEHKEMKVGDFKNLSEVKDIMTAIAVIERYYR